MMKKNSKKAMYDMVKKMNIGGKNPKKQLSATAQAALDAKKAAEEEAAEKARRDAKKAASGMKVYKSGGKRPDYPDVDGDGNEEEPMEQALKDAGKAYKGMKIKKAKGGMKLYNNGGKDENLPEGKMDPKEKANYGAKKARKDAIKSARKEGRRKAGRRGEERVQRTMARTPFTNETEFGPESLRRGQRRRISRRLERTAEKAGVAKDKAYSTEAALAAEVAATDAKDAKKKKKAQRLQRLQNKYRGQKTVTTIGKKKNTRKAVAPGDEEKKKRPKGAIKLRLNRGAKPSSPSTRTNPRRARRPIITRETSGFREHYNRPK